MEKKMQESFHTIRELAEIREKEILSPYASLSAQSKGREREEEPCDIRTAYQRDRDRILHCKAFRRLKHKTQVFLCPQGDHYRDRLTHTLEVSQIARTMAVALSLNEYLTEAIALGHDLGHTPFGHSGEHVLNQLNPGGFVHCEQSVRVVEVLENQEKFLDFVSQAARIYDVGKIQLASLVNKHSRQLTAREMKRIYSHPANGVKLLEKIPSLQKYNDVILGHHKSWDGKMGYPEDFDNTKSKDRLFIEILHISDCIDAATDFVGRSYKSRKKLPQVMEELIQGRGSWYSPQLVELMKDDQALLDELSYLVGPGRIRTCYSVYGRAVDTKETESARLSIDIENWEEESEEAEEEGILSWISSTKVEVRTASFFVPLQEIPFLFCMWI